MNYAPTTQGWYEQQMGIKFPTLPKAQDVTPDGGLNSQAASRTTLSITPPKFLEQFNDFPAWMPRDNQATNQGMLNTYKAGIPAAFDTSGIKTAFNNQINGMMAQGRGHAAAAGAAYGNRALQAGASGAGAGFAQAQAMLPMYDKANQMRSDLAEKELKAKGMANDAQGQVASQQANMAAQREAMMTDYATQQQKFALMNRQMQMEQNAQANAARAASRSRGGIGGGDAAGLARALLDRPEIHSYGLYNNGQPMSYNDAREFGAAQEAQRKRDYIMDTLMKSVTG